MAGSAGIGASSIMRIGPDMPGPIGGHGALAGALPVEGADFRYPVTERSATSQRYAAVLTSPNSTRS
mgnify:CR=1 FL=1